MKFTDLLDVVGAEPVFESSLLMAGPIDIQDVRRQLARWVRSGRLYRLRRGLYALAPPFQKVRPHPFVVANRLVRGSYVSLQSALEHHGLIPEHAATITSVTTRRACRFETTLGAFAFRHVQASMFRGFRDEPLGGGQTARVATAEKAFADLVYLEPGADSYAFVSELRLDGVNRVGIEAFRRTLQPRRKLRRALRQLERLAQEEAANRLL